MDGTRIVLACHGSQSALASPPKPLFSYAHALNLGQELPTDVALGTEHNDLRQTNTADPMVDPADPGEGAMNVLPSLLTE
jgi:hypothetical protein